jgi:hypothetical protein
MTNINRTCLLPSVDSFQYSIPLTSTPKRSNKCSYPQPLSSTLSISTNSCKKMDLSISAITFIKKSSLHQRKRRRYYYQRRIHFHSSKRIELKHLLYSTRAMKQRSIKRSHNELKIYVI